MFKSSFNRPNLRQATGQGYLQALGTAQESSLTKTTMLRLGE